MAVKVSAGLLMYRVREGQIEVFLAHPGGPYSFRKDEDTWSIPKGEVELHESLQEAAIREFIEEVGFSPQGELIALGSIRQKSGKIVHAWAFAGDWDSSRRLVSSNFDLEWPPGSGKICHFPEVDRVGFYTLNEARHKMKAAQQSFLTRLEEILKAKGVLPSVPKAS
jgi:predicted NUDIX family NTP pyrophosphohydrolase